MALTDPVGQAAGQQPTGMGRILQRIRVTMGLSAEERAPPAPGFASVAPIPVTAAPIGPPRTVLIDTVNFCNARCPFCPLFHGDSTMDRELRPATTMPQQVFARMVGEMASWELRPLSLVLSPNSEVLSDRHFAERLDALKQAGLARVTTLLTNGQLLDDRVAGLILDAEIDTVMLGFDGASKAVYEAHRVRCNYERVLANVQNLVRRRQGAAFKTKIVIKYVRTPRNDHEVVAAYNLFNEILDPELDRFNDALAVDWANEGSPVSDLYYYPKLGEGRRLGACNYYDDGMVIQADGKVGACCWDYNLTISDGGLGDASETPLLDIWHGQRRAALQQAFLARDDNIPETCRSCMMIYEWDPVPESWVRFDESVIEARGPTSFMCRFRGPEAIGVAPGG